MQSYNTTVTPAYFWKSPGLNWVLARLPACWVASIALGPTVESIFFVLALTSIAIQPHCITRIKPLLHTPWFISLCLIVLWTTLTALWAPAWDQETWFSLKKSYRFLWLPIFMLGFSEEAERNRGVVCLLLLLLIPAFLSYLKYMHWLTWRDTDPGHLFYNHILTGFLAAFATFLSLEWWVKTHSSWYLLAWAIFSAQVMVFNTGKMAYGLYLIVMLYWLWTRMPRSTRKFAMVMFCLFSGCILLISPACHDGIVSILRDGLSFQHGQRATSLGFRIQFHQFAALLFKKHWLVGGGAGSYAHWFNALKPVPEWLSAPNTHSQYWFVAAESGLIGLGLWGIFLITLWRHTAHSQDYGRNLHALMLMILCNSLTDNVLDRCVGYVFLAFAAMALAALPNTEQDKSVINKHKACRSKSNTKSI